MLERKTMTHSEIVDCIIDHHNRGDETVTVSDIASTLGYNENDVENAMIALKELGLIDKNSANMWWSNFDDIKFG